MTLWRALGIVVSPFDLESLALMFSERAVLHLSTGIRFRTDSLRSIGVSDKSQCWGLWTPRLPAPDNQSAGGKHDEPADADAGVGTLGDYHLVISPFHPASWPFLIEIRLALVDKRGTLARVAKHLRQFDFAKHLQQKQGERELRPGINILHQDQAPTGFNHLTWTVIAEIVAVRQRFEDRKSEHDRDFPQPRQSAGADSARTLAQGITRDMLLCVHHLRESIRTELTDCLSQRLLARKSHLSPDLQQENPKNRRILAAEYQGYVPTAYSVRWMHELPFHAIYGGGSGAPFRMRYRADARELELARPIEYPQYNSLREPVFPQRTANLALATFDTNEHYARIVPISERDRRRRTILLEVDYRIVTRGATVAGLSKGLIAEIGEIMQTNGFSIMSILNKTRDSSLREERGYLRIVAIRKEELQKKRKTRMRIARDVERISNRWQDVFHNREEDASHKAQRQREAEPVVSDCFLEVRCTEPAVAKMFISMNFRHPRRKNLVKLLRRVCADCGLEAVIAKSFSDTATELVRHKIERCDGFLQLLTEPPLRQERKRSWLDFEYGIASGRGLPRIRLVDVASRPYEDWTEIVDIDRDRYCRPINLSKSDADVRKKLEKAVREIAAKLTGD